MKVLLKIYSASCIVVISFFVFFSLPVGSLPFSDGINAIVAGVFFSTAAGAYLLYFYHRDGRQTDWLMAYRGGLFAIGVLALGLLLVLCGLLLTALPHYFVPAFEQGALPIGIAIVSLFWMALIFMCGFLAFGMFGRTAAQFKIFKFGPAAGSAALAFVCLGLAGLFASLFLEVINDIAFRIAEPVRWKATIVFVILLSAAGLISGALQPASSILDEEGRETA